MRFGLALSAAFAAALVATPATAELSANDLARVRVAPPPDARLPTTLAFRTVDGRRTTLGAAADGRPALLIFADYTCRNVCAPGLAIAGHALDASGLYPASYRLIVVGLDPADTPADARAMAKQVLAMPRVSRSVVLLMGDAGATPAAARALGYAYVRDPDTGQFAHDASAYAFGADGRLDAVLPELGVTPAGVKAALAGPEPQATGGVLQGIAHLCYGLAGAHGHYGRPIVLALQALSAALLVGAGALLLRRRRTA